MNIDRYTPRTQGGVFEKNMPVTTFLRDKFFPGVQTFTTNKVEFDVVKGGYSIAPFVAPLVNGIVIDRDGYITKEFEPPTIAPKRVLNPKILEKVIPGETMYSLRTPEERQQYYIDRDMNFLNSSIDRREEHMSASVLTTGKIIVKGYYSEDLTKSVESIIDYGFTNKEVLSGSAAWDQSTSTKYKDLARGVDAVRKASCNPTTVIMGDTAWEDYKNDASVIKMLDTRRIELGVIAPGVRLQNGNGLVYLGDIVELGVQLWKYYGFYKDYDGITKNFIPADHVLIMPDSIGGFGYGAVTYLEQTSFSDGRFVTYEGSRIPRVYVNQQNNTKEIMLSSKPVPLPIDLDSWYVFDVRG